MNVTRYTDLFRLDGRVALVVGGGSGIGQAGAQALAAFGARCAVADVNSDNVRQTVASIREAGGIADAFDVDVRDTASVDRLVADVLATHARIDILLAMPAINIRKRLASYTDDEFDHVVDLNLKGTFRVTRAVAKRDGRVQRACSFTDESLAPLVERCPNLIGFKDGIGDIETMMRIRHRFRERLVYLGGLPTAEVFAPAYRRSA